MPTRHVCQNFFRDALAPFHKYLQNSLLDATTALIKGTFLMLTSIRRICPATHKSKTKLNEWIVCLVMNCFIMITI